MFDDLIEFRTAYLRLVAYHWAAPGKITNGADLWNLLPDMDATKASWRNLKIKANVEDGPEWHPVDASGWSGQHEMSTLELRLPLQPRKTGGGNIRDELWAFAVADFYVARPDGVFANKNKAAPPVPPPPPAPGIVTSLPSGLGDFQTFLEFGAFLMRIIALAWNNTEFRGKVDAGAGGDTEDALQAWLGWNSPWNMRISIKDDDQITYTEPAFPLAAPGPEITQGTWTAGSENILTLNLPKRPDGYDVKLHAVALTTYNNTGEHHPFTCCA